MTLPSGRASTPKGLTLTQGARSHAPPRLPRMRSAPTPTPTGAFWTRARLRAGRTAGDPRRPRRLVRARRDPGPSAVDRRSRRPAAGPRRRRVDDLDAARLRGGGARAPLGRAARLRAAPGGHTVELFEIPPPSEADRRPELRAADAGGSVPAHAHRERQVVGLRRRVGLGGSGRRGRRPAQHHGSAPGTISSSGHHSRVVACRRRAARRRRGSRRRGTRRPGRGRRRRRRPGRARRRARSSSQKPASVGAGPKSSAGAT